MKPHVSLLVQPDQYQLIICKKKSVGYRSLIGEKNQKLIYTFKIINGLAPDYLCSISSGATGNRTHYPLRNALDRDSIARLLYSIVCISLEQSPT